MRKTTYFFAMLALCSMFALTSCGDDDPVPPTESFEQNNAENTDNSVENQGENQSNNQGENQGEDSQAEEDDGQTIKVSLISNGFFEGGGLVFKQTSDNTVEANTTSTDIDKETFDGCFIVPAYIKCDGQKYTVTSLGSDFFDGFSKMTEVSLPTTLLTIEINAFFRCFSLTSVEIPNSVTTIKSNAFASCTSMTSVEIGHSVTTIEFGAFCDCTSLTSVEIPNSVTKIGGSAFTHCTSLTSIVIGNSVTEIGRGAFWNCESLKEITSLNTTPPSIDVSAFSGE